MNSVLVIIYFNVIMNRFKLLDKPKLSLPLSETKSEKRRKEEERLNREMSEWRKEQDV